MVIEIKYWWFTKKSKIVTLIMYVENDSDTSGLDTYDATAGTDNYSMSIKIAFTCANAPFLAFAVLALVAINRTRRTPPTAR